jgi:hypothetical protein
MEIERQGTDFKICETGGPAGDVNGHWVPLCEVGPTAHERQERDTNSDVVQTFGQNM